MSQTATRRRNGTAPKDSDSPKAKPRAKTAGTKAAPRKAAPTKAASKTATKAKANAKPRRGPAAAAKKTASKATEAVAESAPSVSKPKRLAAKLAGKAIKKVAKKMATGTLEAGAGLIRTAADRAASTGHEAAEKTANKRLPIQRSVDIAVPIRVAWEEWMAFESIPEGVHTVTDIERDGDELFGRTSGPRPTDWAAEILDEREQQSFAWQSHEGSDCAGLVTFHDLSKRLTRIELNLDVVPTSLAETFQLTLHLADRRAEAELRRFKARLELINPDLYEEEDEEDAPDAEAEDEGPEAEAEDEGPEAEADVEDDAPEDDEPEDEAPEEDEDTDEQDEAA
jgi:uncharacterized membrane protein